MNAMNAITNAKPNTQSKPRMNPFTKLWWWLRQISGDAAYENYLAHRRVSPQESGTAAMTREKFYADSLHRKYSTINRCC
jgi:uncharacterized short protein YbdD (DUF466 family)